MNQKLFTSETGFVRLCGHRGHCLGAPENTITAFREAHRLGASSLEIDTVLSRDDQIVVLHDLLVDRTTDGVGPALQLTAAEIAALDAGSKFSPAFAGARVPTLEETIALADELDLVVEAEVKEHLALERYAVALRALFERVGGIGRFVMISFDHAHLQRLKRQVPGIRTGGIVHERFADPVAVARMSDLDELCIDLSVFDPEDARRLHDAGIAIRCHAYSPEVFERMGRAGLDWDRDLADWLRAGLIDTLSGDDVAWLAAYIERAGVPYRAK
jgi:glycerophosphoryl diester phosphodiesterase